MYAGNGLDWRYEGIIDGYLKLWRSTSQQRWLEKARRAADDLLHGQTAAQHFARSACEANPESSGLPQTAACDVGLLLLASALRDLHDDTWKRYLRAALRNLQELYIDLRWDTASQSFLDSPYDAAFVPNKAATICDALFLVSRLLNEAQWVDKFVLPTLDRIREHQVHGGSLDGAIAQHSVGGRAIEKYQPISIARCVPALVSGYQWTAKEHYLDAARRALQFITRWTEPDGSCPAVVYRNQSLNRYPSWIAPLGDILRAADLLQAHGVTAELGAMRERLLSGQDASGGIQTARGFAVQIFGSPQPVPDVRDVLHVAGWCDKAFRYLAAHACVDTPSGTSEAFEAECSFKCRTMRFIETPALIEIVRGRRVAYRWHKGAVRPEVAAPEFWLR